MFQVDLPDCEVIAGTPPRIDSGHLSIGKSSQFVSGLTESHIKEIGTRLAQQRGQNLDTLHTIFRPVFVRLQQVMATSNDK